MKLTITSLVAARKVTLNNNEVVYEEPDGHKQHTKDEDNIELKECPAYGKPDREVDIKLEGCQAYVEQKKDMSIRLEECPAYRASTKGLSISLDKCPAYEQIRYT